MSSTADVERVYNSFTKWFSLLDKYDLNQRPHFWQFRQRRAYNERNEQATNEYNQWLNERKQA